MGSYEVEIAAQLGSGDFMQTLVREFHIAGLPLNTSSNGYEASRVIKSGPGFLLGFTVYSSKASGQFVQLHDSATLPADGAVPVLVVSVATVSDKGVLFAIPGRAFLRGIVVCNSSTGPTKTLGSADCFFDAQYI